MGRKLARAGLIAGGVLTALTLIVLLGFERLGLDRWFREPEWAARLVYAMPLEVVLNFKDEKLTLTRPSLRWGVMKKHTNGFESQKEPNLVLVNVRDDAQILCMRQQIDNDDIDACKDQALLKFNSSDLVGILNRHHPAPDIPKDTTSKSLPSADNEEALEVQVDLRLGGHLRTFLVRLIKLKGESRMFVLAGGARKLRFDRLEAEIRKILESFTHNTQP